MGARAVGGNGGTATSLGGQGGLGFSAQGGTGSSGGKDGDAALFAGNVSITSVNGSATQVGNLIVANNINFSGTLTGGTKSFKIDHPLDPENKFLYHSCVESPDMKNIYDGVVVLDEKGEATVELPAYFEALNKDFRYQLTCVGGYAPVYIAEEVHANRFKIAGGRAGLKVSWLVTGTRHDSYADAHRIQVEVEKSASEKGKLAADTRAKHE
jgi:hypothetical protein